jgi:hypothetical protein
MSSSRTCAAKALWGYRARRFVLDRGARAGKVDSSLIAIKLL